jgi:hypothetical protein
MKGDRALVTLSPDHHLALYVARTLKRATADTASDGRAAFVGYWEEHGREHFRLEEEILLPAYAHHGDPHHPLVARALCDHVDIRARVPTRSYSTRRPTRPSCTSSGPAWPTTSGSRSASSSRSSRPRSHHPPRHRGHRARARRGLRGVWARRVDRRGTSQPGR